MRRRLTGVVVATPDKKTVIVQVSWRMPHPMYKKLLKRSSRFKADPKKLSVAIGDTVRIDESRPLARDKYFVVSEIMTKSTVVDSQRKEENV